MVCSFSCAAYILPVDREVKYAASRRSLVEDGREITFSLQFTSLVQSLFLSLFSIIIIGELLFVSPLEENMYIYIIYLVYFIFFYSLWFRLG